ncbi:MAG: biotin--[acetyl-CoA-carboxylase] ligase [bacterium]
MNIIKLNAIGSTNDYAKSNLKVLLTKIPVVIWTENQTQGKGQRGAKWITEEGKCLTFSLVMRSKNVTSTSQFKLNKIVSLSILEILKKYNVPNLAIKWPNDIMSANRKLGGILIESNYRGNTIESFIIGVGLNINQLNMSYLPKATSVAIETGVINDISHILTEISNAIERSIKDLNTITEQSLNDRYLEHLFKYQKPCTFNTQEIQNIPGIIQGIDATGKLLVQFQADELPQAFDLKEIEMLY